MAELGNNSAEIMTFLERNEPQAPVELTGFHLAEMIVQATAYANLVANTPEEIGRDLVLTGMAIARKDGALAERILANVREYTFIEGGIDYFDTVSESTAGLLNRVVDRLVGPNDNKDEVEA